MFNKGDRVYHWVSQGEGFEPTQRCGTVIRVNPLTYRIAWDNWKGLNIGSQLVYKGIAHSTLKLVDWDESK